MDILVSQIEVPIKNKASVMLCHCQEPMKEEPTTGLNRKKQQARLKEFNVY